MDLNVVKETVTPAPMDVVATDLPLVDLRRFQFQTEFQGQSELLCLHGMLIAILRRNSPPPDALSLFLRLWKEHGRWLAKELPLRWKISAATTFGECGATLEQRALGMGLSILFDSIKLHESERRLSGQSPDVPFRTEPLKDAPQIAFGLASYSLKKGDMDRNMLARLYAISENDTVIFPLARSMLMQVMSDRKTVFARLEKIKNHHT
ncbi:hypothetical protein L0664_09175 [Octadecabacter sp. G9-8]|uniref:Uncharacterized protein n=1 Tax=Octadecabacter dasysiphoniae TaxID=2909341 RepID=A0ABS9CVD7_9RHOB|nr:hypothetical protein [Octadecabacter dasysiphoniae]